MLELLNGGLLVGCRSLTFGYKLVTWTVEERFNIIKTLGKGRTGGVYEAIDTVTNQRVALRRFFSVTGDTDASSWRESFIALAQNLATVQHPALMGIHASGVDEDGAFMAMELLEGGRSLEEIIEKDGHLSDEEFYVMANNLLDAFSVLHYQGFCHGSVSGRSIMEVPIPTGGHVYKCVDLGMSSMIPMINPSMPFLACGDPALTAPELFEGKQPDARSDVYMLGHLFYLSLAGGHPLAGIPAEEAHVKHKGHKFAPLSGYRSSVPKDIVAWIEHLTQADPEARPQSAGEALELMPVHHFGGAPAAAAQPALKPQPTMARAQTFGAAYGVKNTASPGLKVAPKKSSAGLVIGLIGGAVAVLFIIIVAASSSSTPPPKPKPDKPVVQDRIPTRTVDDTVDDPVDDGDTGTGGDVGVLVDPDDVEKKVMERISYADARRLLSLEGIKEGKKLEAALVVEDASGAVVCEAGDLIQFGDVVVKGIFPKSKKLKSFKDLGVSVDIGGEEISEVSGVYFKGQEKVAGELVRFSVRNFEGDMKVRLVAHVRNLKVRCGVAIAGMLKENISVKEMSAEDGLVVYEIEVKDVTESQFIALDFKLLEKRENGEVAQFVPLAMMAYDGEYPELPKVFEPKPEPEPEPDPVVEKKPEFPNGVKITPNGDGTKTIELGPLEEK